jgi:hypothetical protein
MSETQNKKEIFQSESSIFSNQVQKPQSSQAMFPTWFLIVFLFICFFLLKGFIYISDKKRHGK